MTENKRYEFDVMNGGGYVVGYSERMSDDISLIFTRLCEVPTKTQAEKVCNELKGLQKENEQLKQQNKELKSDNDIKFWKLQCIRFSNGNGIILHEISRAIEEGYEVSNEFKQYLHDLKVQNEKNVEKAKRLGI